MKKLFTLMTLLLCAVTGVWAADYTVSAQQTMSNDNKTCTWTSIKANNGDYFQSGKTALGSGMYFVANGKCTLDGGEKVNVKAKGEMYLEVPIATAEGSVTMKNGNSTERYMETVSGAKLYMQGDNTVNFTSADIVTVEGVTYLKLTSKSDCKFEGVSITLTSGQYASLGVQEITSVSLNGVAISEADLATLKSEKAVSIDGSELNGAGIVDVALSNGGTEVVKSIEGTSAIFKFTINETDEYTVTVTNIAKTYTKLGSVVAYKENETKAEGADSKTLTMNGISFAMVANDKTFQFGNGSVTLGEDVYVSLKLSTGSAVNVSFPEGKKAVKVKVYGWSANGTGKLTAMKETADGEKSVDVSNDVYYATNTAADLYPSVYEYNLDNWESFYFSASGSPSQPFVVMDFVFAAEEPQVIDTWAIVGSQEILGTHWLDDAEASKANQMTSTDNVNFTLVKENCTLKAGTYGFKVVKDYSWVVNYGADGGTDNNASVSIPTDGIYTVTFTFVNDNSHALSAVAEKTGDAVIEDDYYAVGVEELWGVSWKVDEANKLAKDTDGKYKITKTDLTLNAGQYGYKIIKNGAWIPEGEGNEKKLAISERAIYSVTLTVDPEDVENYSAVATKTGEATPVENLYYVVGNCYIWNANTEQTTEDPLFLGEAWNLTYSANLMEKQSDGTYKKVYSAVDIPAYTTIIYKVAKNGSWDGSYGFPATQENPTGNADYKVNEDCKADVIFTLDLTNTEYPVSCTLENVLPTGINTIATDNQQNGTVYDLMGRRVENMQKGLYIINGRKYVK